MSWNLHLCLQFNELCVCNSTLEKTGPPASQVMVWEKESQTPMTLALKILVWLLEFPGTWETQSKLRRWSLPGQTTQRAVELGLELTELWESNSQWLRGRGQAWGWKYGPMVREGRGNPSRVPVTEAERWGYFQKERVASGSECYWEDRQKSLKNACWM